EALTSSLELRAFDQALSEAKTREERWTILREALKKFGLVDVQWYVDGKTYHDALWNTSGQECWSLRVPLGSEDYVHFARLASKDDSSLNVGALVTIVRKCLSREASMTLAASAAAGSGSTRPSDSGRASPSKLSRESGALS